MLVSVVARPVFELRRGSPIRLRCGCLLLITVVHWVRPVARMFVRVLLGSSSCPLLHLSMNVTESLPVVEALLRMWVVSLASVGWLRCLGSGGKLRMVRLMVWFLFRLLVFGISLVPAMIPLYLWVICPSRGLPGVSRMVCVLLGRLTAGRLFPDGIMSGLLSFGVMGWG